MPQDFKPHPREAFYRHVFISPAYEDNMQELAELIPVERILFGSDFPHPEGLAELFDLPQGIRRLIGRPHQEDLSWQPEGLARRHQKLMSR